jgi:SAM-dependent methyltransferase
MDKSKRPKPTYLAERIVENDRLAYYMSAADINFWDNHWQTHFDPAAYDWADTGPHLGCFEWPFTRYLPKTGPILEAGCGLGHYVAILRARGYDVEGVEWSRKTVETVLSVRPALPIRVGDVTRLEVPDGYYSGYISVGVVEHRRAGPEPFLQEAYRVLAPNGLALISVPYFHPLRQLKARLKLYQGRPNGLEFYQYAFTVSEFTGLLRTTGFRIVDRIPYDGFKGIKDEIPWLRPILTRLVEWRGVGWRLRRWLQHSTFGHMLLAVCQKSEVVQ